MTDEELAEIENENGRRFKADLTCCGSYNDTAKLIAEVRRLKAENEDLKHKLYDERAYSSELRKQL